MLARRPRAARPVAPLPARADSADHAQLAADSDGATSDASDVRGGSSAEEEPFTLAEPLVSAAAAGCARIAAAAAPSLAVSGIRAVAQHQGEQQQ